MLSLIFILSDSMGTLGLGPTQEEMCSLPTRLTNFAVPISSISCGRYHTMALSTTGELYSWGFNSYGQLGHGNYEEVSSPTRITTTLEVI